MNEPTVKCSGCRAPVSRYAVDGYGSCDSCRKTRDAAQRANCAAQPQVDVKCGDTIRITIGARVYEGSHQRDPVARTARMAHRVQAPRRSGCGDVEARARRGHRREAVI